MRFLSRKWFEFFSLGLSNRELVEKSRKEGNTTAFTRSRKLNFLSVLLTILDVGRETTGLKLDRLRQQLSKGKVSMMEVSQQAFSKARNQITEYALVTLFNSQIAAEYTGAMGPMPRRMDDGWRILAIDGTKIALPNLPEFREKYFTTGAGATSPTALGSCLYDVTNNRVIDAILSPELDERKCALSHIVRYDELCPKDGKTLFTLDRGYPSKDLIKAFEEKDMRYLMRCRTKFSLAVDALAVGCDTVVDIGGHDVRVVKLELESGQIETLITNDHEHPAAQMKALYFMRWGEECMYKTLKTRFQLENFTGKTENTVKQDFWATILACTMLMVLEEDVDQDIQKQHVGKGNKYEYQVNRSMFVGIMKDDLIFALTARNPVTLNRRMDAIIKRAARFVCPIRPGRKTERAENRRKTKFHHNHRSNC